MASKHRIALRLKVAFMQLMGTMPEVSIVPATFMPFSTDRFDKYIDVTDLREEARFEDFLFGATADLEHIQMFCNPQIEKTAKTRFCDMRMTDRRRHDYLKDRRTHKITGRPRSFRELNALLSQSV